MFIKDYYKIRNYIELNYYIHFNLKKKKHKINFKNFIHINLSTNFKKEI